MRFDGELETPASAARPKAHDAIRCNLHSGNRRWRLPFRCRGSRREPAVAQLSTLGIIPRHAKKRATILD